MQSNEEDKTYNQVMILQSNMTSCKRSAIEEPQHALDVQSRKKGKSFLSGLMKVYGRGSSEKWWQRNPHGEGCGSGRTWSAAGEQAVSR